MLNIEDMYLEMGIRREVYDFGSQIEGTLKERFDAIDKVAEYNQLKVLHAMQKTVSVQNIFPEVPDMATTMMEGIRWKRYMLIHSTRKMPW